MSASAALSGAASGASLGAAFGPYGALVGGALGGIAGALKKDPAKDPKNNVPRPRYNIPKEVFQNQAMYDAMSKSSRVPGQSYIENQIGQNQAQALSASQKAAGSSADALSAVSGIQQNSNNQYNELGRQGAEFQFMNKDKLAAANREVADYKQQEFDYNQNQPYQTSYAQKQKIQDQQMMNNNNSINNLVGLGMTYAGQAGSGSNIFSMSGGQSANQAQSSTPSYSISSLSPYDSTKKYNTNTYLKK